MFHNRRQLISISRHSFVGGSTDSAAATNFLARTSGLDATHTNAYKTLLNGLTTDGIFDAAGASTKLDALYIYATANRTTAVLNLVKNSFNCVEHTYTANFTADRGYQGNGAFYLDTQFVPNTGTNNYLLHSASMGAYVLSNGATNSGFVYGASNLIDTALNLAASAGFVIYNMNGAASSNPSISNTHGFWINTITSSGTLQLYNFKTSSSAIDTTSVTATLLDNGPVFSMADNNGTPYFPATVEVAAMFIGGGLSSSDAGKLSTRINAYMTTFSINAY